VRVSRPAITGEMIREFSQIPMCRSFVKRLGYEKFKARPSRVSEDLSKRILMVSRFTARQATKTQDASDT
jgi:hypothetical protein